MSESNKAGPKLAGALAGAAGAGLSVAGASGPLGVAAGAVGLVTAARAVYGAWQEWQDERVKRLLLEAYFENAADEGFAAYIAAEIQDPRKRRLFMESVRAALESVADEVLPAVAALMREYERSGAEVDGRFRALCRVLQDLSAEEYRSFRALFRSASGDGQLLDSLQVSFARTRDGRSGAEEVVAAGVKEQGMLRPLLVEDCDPRHFPRLSHLMYVHNLGNALSSTSVTFTGKEVFDELRLAPTEVAWVAHFLVK